MKKLVPWLVVLALIVVVFGSIYAAVQQSQRSAANYPQIQQAEDAAMALNRGDVPQAVVFGRVDMAKSLATFMIIYDKAGHVVSGSGYLDGKVPSVPVGVLKASQGKAYNAITWQPRTDVRIAAVATSAKKYYVVSGRSLTEIEKNETTTLQIAVLGGLVALTLLAMVFVLSAVSPEY